MLFVCLLVCILENANSTTKILPAKVFSTRETVSGTMRRKYKFRFLVSMWACKAWNIVYVFASGPSSRTSFVSFFMQTISSCIYISTETLFWSCTSADMFWLSSFHFHIYIDARTHIFKYVRVWCCSERQNAFVSGCKVKADIRLKTMWQWKNTQLRIALKRNKNPEKKIVGMNDYSASNAIKKKLQPCRTSAVIDIKSSKYCDVQNVTLMHLVHEKQKSKLTANAWLSRAFRTIPSICCARKLSMCIN